MTGKERGRYTAAVGASAVTLSKKLHHEDAARSGEPGIFGPVGVGTIVITTVGTPSAQFWKNASTGAQYLFEVSRVN